MRRLLVFLIVGFTIQVNAQNKGWEGKFEQLDQMLPTPNSYRTGSGAPPFPGRRTKAMRFPSGDQRGLESREVDGAR